MESMKKVGKIIKKYKLLIIGIVLGGIIAGGGVYASTVGASNVSYSNASSGLSATTAQGAIDSLVSQASELKYFKYYYECHSISIDNTLFTKQHKSIRGVFSFQGYGDLLTNLGNNSAASDVHSFTSDVSNCCKSSSYCNASSGTCYNKCYTGYDEYLKSC